MKRYIPLGLTLFLVLCTGCASKFELKKKFMMEKWNLCIWPDEYKVSRQQENPGTMMKTDIPLGTYSPEKFTAVYETMREEMGKAFPEIKVKIISDSMDQWAKKYDHHVVVRIWAESDYKAMGRRKFCHNIYINYVFYEVDKGRVHPMDHVTPTLAHVYGDTFDAGKGKPNYKELYAVYSEERLMDKLVSEVKSELADFIEDIQNAKE